VACHVCCWPKHPSGSLATGLGLPGKHNPALTLLPPQCTLSWVSWLWTGLVPPSISHLTVVPCCSELRMALEAPRQDWCLQGKTDKIRYKTEILYYEGGEALEQVAHGSRGCPLSGNIQGQVGWGFEQPGLVEGALAHGRGVGTR